jgi:hypothetical protein
MQLGAAVSNSCRFGCCGLKFRANAILSVAFHKAFSMPLAAHRSRIHPGVAGKPQPDGIIGMVSPNGGQPS